MGAMADAADQDKYYISTNNLIEGMDKEDYPAYSDLVVKGSYDRGVQTQYGGYEGKKLSAAFQSTVLGDKGSDCGTNKTLRIEITEGNKNLFLYRYINTRGSKKLTELNSENIDNYIGKMVSMRSPLFCKADNLCNKCAGNLYYQLKIKNVGLLFYKVGSRIMQLSMKAFHDSTIQLKEIEIEKYIT